MPPQPYSEIQRLTQLLKQVEEQAKQDRESRQETEEQAKQDRESHQEAEEQAKQDRESRQEAEEQEARSRKSSRGRGTGKTGKSQNKTHFIQNVPSLLPYSSIEAASNTARQESQHTRLDYEPKGQTVSHSNQTMDRISR